MGRPRIYSDEERRQRKKEQNARRGPRPYNPEYYAANRDNFWAKQIRYLYGLEAEQYEAMLEAQGHVCAICKKPEKAQFHGRPKRLSIDHCHTSGAVRGLLCSLCNWAIGKLRDNPAAIRSAADYVEAHQ
jgi:hypothetical protein